MAKKYLVEAHCDNPACKCQTFEKVRPKMTYLSSEGHERIISRLTCPDCKMLGHVDKILSLETRKRVA